MAVRLKRTVAFRQSCSPFADLAALAREYGDDCVDFTQQTLIPVPTPSAFPLLPSIFQQGLQHPLALQATVQRVVRLRRQGSERVAGEFCFLQREFLALVLSPPLGKRLVAHLTFEQAPSPVDRLKHLGF